MNREDLGGRMRNGCIFTETINTLEKEEWDKRHLIHSTVLFKTKDEHRKMQFIYCIDCGEIYLRSYE